MNRAGLFGVRASFHLSYTVKRKLEYLKNKGTSLGNVVPNPGLLLRNFASVYRSSKSVIVLARHGGRSERDKLDRRRSTKLTMPPSSDARPLVYHNNHQALSTA